MKMKGDILGEFARPLPTMIWLKVENMDGMVEVDGVANLDCGRVGDMT